MKEHQQPQPQNIQRSRAGVVPCFTPGAAVLTERGCVPVERLRIGDRVQTSDNGLQPVRWIGRRAVDTTSQLVYPSLRPVVIAPGALGNRDWLTVSPEHRFIARDPQYQEETGEYECFIKARHLLEAGHAVARIASPRQPVTYIHFLTDAHEVVFVDGVATETLFPSARVLQAMSPDALDELALLFPDLFENKAPATLPGQPYGARARPDRNQLPSWIPRAMMQPTNGFTPASPM